MLPVSDIHYCIIRICVDWNLIEFLFTIELRARFGLDCRLRRLRAKQQSIQPIFFRKLEFPWSFHSEVIVMQANITRSRHANG